MMPADTSVDFQPTNVDQMQEAAIVPDCETNMTIVDSIGEDSLIDGQPYWIGAVAYDKFLNGDTGDVTILEVTPYVNNINGATEPERISELNAWDHPDDDGTAIDISWAPSEVDDFDYYVVWVSEYPLNDLTEFWPIAGTEPGICGCIVMDRQWIDTSKSPINLTVNTALYGGNSLSTSIPKQIIPNIELYVTVTVHDIKGNVHLDELNTAMVTPIDNNLDTTPPERLSELNLYDRPADDGSAVLLEFELSQDSDVAYYEVYAAAFTFTSVGVNGNVKTPIANLSRTPSLPLVIDMLYLDVEVVRNMPVNVAVVPVDWSGNAYTDKLVTSSAIAIDNDVDNVGGDLPDIQNVRAVWIDDSIVVTWDYTDDASVIDYLVLISDTQFNDIGDAESVGRTSVSNSFTITKQNFPDLDTETTWWVGVSASDRVYDKQIIDSTRVDSPGSSSGGDSDSDDESSTTNFGELLTTDNMIIAGMILITLLLLLLLVRGRGRKPAKNREWELQEATWGIQARDGWDDVGSFGGQVAPPVAPPPAIQPKQQSDIYSSSERVQQPQEAQPQRWSQPSQQSQPGIDTSFLDDLL